MPAVTNKGAVLRISTTPVTTALDQAGFDALSYTDIGKVVTRPSFGSTANIISIETLDTEIVEKQKGIESGNDSEIVVRADDADAGQIALRAAAAAQNVYALQFEFNNSLGTNGTTLSGLFIIGGSGSPGGGNEDFDTENYSAAMTLQRALRKAAA